MAIISGASVFLVADIVTTADYYRDKLGFRYDRFWGAPPDFCVVWRDEQCIMLNQVNDQTLIRPVSTIRDIVWNAYFWVTDYNAMHAELKSATQHFIMSQSSNYMA